MDKTNLVYNGDFSKGTDSFSGTDITASNGVLTVTGDLVQSTNYLIPVVTGKKYRLSYDIKFNTTTGSTNQFLIALRCYDNTKNHIAIQTTNKVANTNTTLANAVANGDTTVKLTSSANWNTATSSHVIGICDMKAWGYNRCRLRIGYTTGTISNNTLTLTSAWNQGSFAAGTPVACFLAGSTYYYPNEITQANLPTTWKTYSVDFNGGNPMRYSTQYFQFGTLGYTYNYSIRNLRIECIDDIQLNHWDNKEADLTKEGILKSLEFNDIGMPIRYIRDTISGNTVNTGNHWNEFQVYNYVGENIAWGRALTYGSGTTQSGTVSNGYITDGKVNSSYNSFSGGSNAWVKLDLGYVENIHKIKIWHYYPDGRTYYNNITEVSTDGTNWITVYKGQKPETAAGNEIILTSANTQLLKNGEIFANEFIEL